MSLAALLALWSQWIPAPVPDPVPDLVVVVDEPGAEVIVKYRSTNRSKRIWVETWKDAKVVKVVNGQPG
jgi:hypothetical protein